MKRILFTVCLLLGSLGLQAQKVSILGDSYSTFPGYITPAWNFTWYGTDYQLSEGVNDVRKVEQTWWHQVMTAMNYTLEKNNAFSGSTVSYTGYNGEVYADRAFITRMADLGDPDVILVLAGTNDSWAGAPVGHYIYSNWTRQQLFSFRPAFCYMMDYLVRNYPKARILNICNSELSPEVTETEAEVCAHFQVQNLLLRDIEKQNGHPSIAGMKAIASQVIEALAKRE